MANSVTAIYQGQDYQARLFWREACRLFWPHSKVLRVGHEIDGVKAFDDVSAKYSEPLCDERGDYYQADYYQVKFHVDHAGAFTCENLMDPAFIGATSFSLLQRLRSVQTQLAPDGTGARFHIVAPWPIHPEDQLASLVSNQGGELRLNVLFEGGTRSRMGKLRSVWCGHLGIEDAELLSVLKPLRIHSGMHNLVDLGDRLSESLCLAGLQPIPAGAMINPYDELIRKLAVMGKKEFTKGELRQICASEGLWVGQASQETGAVQLGVRSFMRWTDTMQDEIDQMLSLVRHFDNRNIVDAGLWSTAVYPELEAFLLQSTRSKRPHHLRLATHNSIAIAAGYCMDPKSGTDIAPVQSTAGGPVVWKPVPSEANAALGSEGLPGWHCTQTTLSTGDDVALAIAVSHDIGSDVETYVRQYDVASSLITCTIACGPSTTSIRSGTHAWLLAQDLVRLVRQNRTADQRRGRLHIFASAPNAFLFFLGQHGRALGRSVIYEYDFEDNQPDGYQPALVFPPRSNSPRC